MQPTVSVVMSVYNTALYVEEALDSIAALDPAPDEVIVVDDGSTDGTGEKVRRHPLPLRYVHQENQGSGAAKNRGVELAGSELVAFLDADDLYEKGALAALRAPFERDPECRLVFGHYLQFFSPDIPEELKQKLYCPMGPQPAVMPGGMMCRRELYLGTGGFPAGKKTGDFVEWYLRAKDLGVKQAMVPETVLRRRLHANNKGVQMLGNMSFQLRSLKASLDRRRAREGSHENP